MSAWVLRTSLREVLKSQPLSVLVDSNTDGASVNVSALNGMHGEL